MKLFNRFSTWIVVLFVLSILTVSVSAESNIDKDLKVLGLDTDIVITYEIPGYPQTVYVGVIPDKVPYPPGPGMDFYNREQMDLLVGSFFRANLILKKIPTPDSYSYTVVYKTDPEKSYSDVVYISYTKNSLT